MTNTPTAGAAHPLSHLVGEPIPAGRFTFENFENWLGHDALYSNPEQYPHPVMAFIVAQRGLGVTVAELFGLWGTAMADGPMLTESVLEFPGEFRADTQYDVVGTVESVTRKSGRTLGVFDLLTARFELRSTGDHPVVAAAVTNTYALPRMGES